MKICVCKTHTKTFLHYFMSFVLLQTRFLGALKHTACLLFNPFTVGRYASLFKFTSDEPSGRIHDEQILKVLGTELSPFSVFLRWALVGVFLVILPSSKTTFDVIPRFLFYCNFNLPYGIIQMSKFHLVWIYTFFIATFKPFI